MNKYFYKLFVLLISGGLLITLVGVLAISFLFYFLMKS